MAFAEYASYDGLALAELVRKGEVKPLELVEEAIARIERRNPELNAVVSEMYESARGAASSTPPARPGPFHGVPMVLKDLMAEACGTPLTSGSRLLEGHVPQHDAELVVRYRSAGLIPVARTNAPEFGIVPTTEPLLYGATRNPWNPAHSVGGSSGGSAAAVAAGVVPIGHANDGGGSIRIPASCCGLVGLKPTRGRNPLGPMLGDVMGGLVCEHVVTRTVRDSAAVLDHTAGPDLGDPYVAPAPERPYLEEVEREPGRLRLAYWSRRLDGEPAHAECVAAAEGTARLCEELGHVVEEAEPNYDPAVVLDAFLRVWAAGLTAAIDSSALLAGRPVSRDRLEPLTWGLYERGRALSASEYQIALGQLQLVARQVARFFARYDAWITPTLGEPPLRLGVIDVNEPDPDRAFAPIVHYVPFTATFNATGQPAISLPLHWTPEGLPVGVQLAGRYGEEGLLYRLGGQLERARPWIERRPPIWD